MTKTIIETKIQHLKEDLQKGEQEIRQLQNKEKEMQGTLLRIKGAIQVLQDLLAELEANDSNLSK